MRAMVVEVVPELKEFIFEICGRPEQRVIQTLASNRTDEPFGERMRKGNAGDALDFSHLQNPQIGLPLMELIKRVVGGGEVLCNPELPAKRALEHSTKGHTIAHGGRPAEAKDTWRLLIHDDQDPVSPQRSRLAPEQIH